MADAVPPARRCPPDRRRPCGATRLRAAALCLGVAAAAPAIAADVEVIVDGLRSDRGQVLIAICSPERFTGRGCEYTARADAGSQVLLRGIAPGRYAVQAFHDENANGILDRGLFRPVEGMAFSRGARMRSGPPEFRDAEVAISEPGGRLRLTITYFQ